MMVAPPSASVVIHALRSALWVALCPRANGSRHDRGCRNAAVNSQWHPCSPSCEKATGALLLAEDWEAVPEHEIRALPPVQPRLFEDVAS